MSAAATAAVTPEVARFLQVAGMEHATTMNVLKAVPAGKLDFRPHPKSMSAGELAWHIAESQLMLSKIVATARFEIQHDATTPATISEIVAECDKRHQQACALLAALTAEQLQAKIDLPAGISVPAAGLMWSLVLFHEIHHRGQLSVYIRLMEGKVPSIYGPSADVNPFA